MAYSSWYLYIVMSTLGGTDMKQCKHCGSQFDEPASGCGGSPIGFVQYIICSTCHIRLQKCNGLSLKSRRDLYK